MLEKLLLEKSMSVYECSKLSGIPYTTLLEVVRGKTNICKCSVEIVYKIAKTLNVSVEDLVSEYIEIRIDFEIFRSNICHKVKQEGDLDYIINTLKSDEVRRLWDKKWYPEAFYVLAMIDYLSRLNNVPLCLNYNDIRSHSLKQLLYPKEALMRAKLDNSFNIKECLNDAIPEFLRFNIVESGIRDVY